MILYRVSSTIAQDENCYINSNIQMVFIILEQTITIMNIIRTVVDNI